MRGAHPDGGPPWWRSGPGRPGPPPHWHHRRANFMRRMRWLLFGILLLAGVGVTALAWLAAGVLGITRAALPVPLLALPPLGMLALVLAAGMIAVRRVATPFGDVMMAADQVASGDYSIRVIERGPPAVRALARAFNRMTERLAQHDIARRDLMAEIAHELRTPLTVMQGRLEGLLDGVYPRDDSSLEQVLDDTRVLARLVEDLRTLALSEAGVLRLELEVTDPSVLVHDVVTGFAPQAAAAHVALAAEIAGSLPALELDPVRIGQVLGNLIANAIAHTPAGGRVEVRVRATPDGGMEVTVQDTGQGMTRADVDRMFERFQKGPASRGSGLGLTIARNLVLAHGGTVTATSEPGRGTTICVTLPGPH